MPMQIQQQRPQITAAAAALTIQFLQGKSLSTQQLAQRLLAAPFSWQRVSTTGLQAQAPMG